MMAWFFGILIFVVVLGIFSILLGYPIAQRILGREAAHRSLSYVIPMLLFFLLLGAFLAFVLMQFGAYGGIVISGFSALVLLAWLLSWPSRKRKAGTLLFDAERSSQIKYFFQTGLLTAIIAILQTYFLLRLGMYVVPLLSLLTMTWIIPIYFIAIGSSKIEFREHGICVMYGFLAWRRIRLYQWERSKPTTLTFNLTSNFPLLPRFASIVIPIQHRDAVSNLLNKYLPEKQAI